MSRYVTYSEMSSDHDETLRQITNHFQMVLNSLRRDERHGKDVNNVYIDTLHDYIEDISAKHKLFINGEVRSFCQNLANREAAVIERNKSLLLKINHLEEELLVDCEVREERLTEQNNILSEGAAQLEQQLSDQGRKTKWLESMIIHLKEKNQAFQLDVTRSKSTVKHLEGKLQQVRREVKILNQKFKFSEQVVFSHQAVLHEKALQNKVLLQDLEKCKIAYEYETTRLFQHSKSLWKDLQATTHMTNIMQRKLFSVQCMAEDSIKLPEQQQDEVIVPQHSSFQHQQNECISGIKLRLSQHEDLLLKLHNDVEQLLGTDKGRIYMYDKCKYRQDMAEF